MSDNYIVSDRIIWIARAIKAIVAGKDLNSVSNAVSNYSFLAYKDVEVGKIAYAWWCTEFEGDLFANPNDRQILDFEKDFAARCAYAYLAHLKEFLDAELPTEQPKTAPIDSKYESTYVGVLNHKYKTIVKVIEKKLVNGHYGQSTLITFHDKYNNVIKTFAKPTYAQEVVLGFTYVLEGLVGKHHVFGGAKETIIKQAVLDTNFPNVHDDVSSMSLI